MKISSIRSFLATLIACAAVGAPAFAQQTSTGEPAQKRDQTRLVKSCQLLTEACALHDSRHLQEAIDKVKMALDIDADYELAWYNLAVFYQKAGQLQNCIDTANEFLSRFPQSERAKGIAEMSAMVRDALKERNKGGQSSVDNYLSRASAYGVQRWDTRRMPLKVYIEPGSRTRGYRQVMRMLLEDSFQEWSVIAGRRVTFALVPRKDLADIDCSWVDDVRQVIAPTELGDTAVYQSSDGYITKASIRFLSYNPAWKEQLTDARFRNVCLHEIGHALGLVGHSDRIGDVMYFQENEVLHDARKLVSNRDAKTLLMLYQQSPGEHLIVPKPPSDSLADRVIDMNNQAIDLARSCHYTEAEKLLQDAISMLETASEKDPQQYQLALRNYAKLLRLMKRDAEAAAIDNKLNSVARRATGGA